MCVWDSAHPTGPLREKELEGTYSGWTANLWESYLRLQEEQDTFLLCAAGDLYALITTLNNPDGELRGQVRSVPAVLYATQGSGTVQSAKLCMTTDRGCWHVQ